MGNCFGKGYRCGDTEIYAGNIIFGDDNIIQDNTSNPSPVVPALDESTKNKDRGNLRITLNNVVKGKRNIIKKGHKHDISNGSKAEPSTSGGSNFVKKVDDKDWIRNRRIVSKASESIGIIRGPWNCGTGFRVGDSYIMTALHVVKDSCTMAGKTDYRRIKDNNFYIEFEFIKLNQKQNPQNIYYFKDLVYTNEELDTAVLELADHGRPFPPSINVFDNIDYDRGKVYLIGHPNGEVQMDDPKIEFCQLNLSEVNNSIRWASCKLETDCSRAYHGFDDDKKVLFHCASQHGASGALGCMVIPHYDTPVGVVMLLRGYPSFYYSKNHSFSDEDKQNFVMVEQGVLLTSIEQDMRIKMPDLKSKIFSTTIRV